MSDLINNLLLTALDCGLTHDQFWDMSFLEVGDVIESHIRMDTERRKQELAQAHFLAKDIGQYVSLVLNGSDNVTIMELWDYFPELFAEEKAVVEKEQAERQLAVYVEQMKDFAYQHNNLKGGGE